MKEYIIYEGIILDNQYRRGITRYVNLFAFYNNWQTICCQQQSDIQIYIFSIFIEMHT